MIYNMFIESLYHPVKNNKKKKVSFGVLQNSNDQWKANNSNHIVN